MDRKIILAFDVGGTQIKAAAVIGGSIVDETVAQYESRAEQSAEDIITHFAGIAADIVKKISGEPLPIGGLGLAFPGPFDYANGISRIKGLGKFESLFGLPVGKLLLEAIQSNSELGARLLPSFDIKFENDAALFGLGEARYGEARFCERAVCLTIGTGLGSCFLENGRLVKNHDLIPDQGWLYNVPYQGKLADDWISKRGILQLGAEMGIKQEGHDVRDFARMAQAGDRASTELFEVFGRRMADILAPPLRAYAPDRIVIGGQISKSGSLFVPFFAEGLIEAGIQSDIRLSNNTLYSTLKGIYDILVF
ncbi:ROK family protein [Paenibacillus pinihumi]|uniref:ROK family protein n=1 Tax=Paenibacillus pinihumi TaxID=669462 RepID=UPI000424235F|nr:ROK family protein [Paenibacillus pinihumi]